MSLAFHDQPGGEISGAVDVVIPMRDGASTIPATLASVAAQTVLPRRIIVVDDGSTDGGADLVRGHPLVDVIMTPPLGVSHARNAGIRASRAEFVAVLDCDDLWRADKLKRQLETARRHPDAAVITCDEILITTSRMPIKGATLQRRFQGHVLDEMLRCGFAVGGLSSSMVVRRHALLGVGGYDQTLSLYEDLDICLRLARDYSVCACPEVLVFVVENPASTTRRPASPERTVESCLQGLVAMEPWIGRDRVTRAVAHNCARLILSRFVRAGLHPRRLSDLRSQMQIRTPKLASRIARSDLHLMVSLLEAGVVGFANVLAILRRHFARRSAARRERNLPAIQPRALPAAPSS